MSEEIPHSLSAGEAHFEFLRKRIGLLLAPIALIMILANRFESLTPEAHALAAIVVCIMILWMTEALPLAVTGLMAPTLMVILDVAPAAKAFSPFADPIMFLFIGAFILARALSYHELDRRFAYWVLTRPWVGESPSRILLAYGGVCCFISMWISNTATCAMMFPIGLAIITSLKKLNNQSVSDQYASGVMLMCAFAASIGGLATPVGTPTNLIGLGFIRRELGVEIPFFQWMTFSIPIVIVLYLLLFAYLNWFCPAGISKLSGIREWMFREREQFGSLTAGQRNTLIACGVTVALWITPGILALALGDHHAATKTFSKLVPESVAALIGTCLLFLLPVDWAKQKFTIPVREAFEIDWGVLMLYGGGIALGQMVFETKLGEMLGHNLTGWVPAAGIGLLAVSALVAIVTSEFTSNVSSANMVVPVIILLAGANGLPAAIAATMAASLGFMLPISTPTNAIVYSSGYIPLGRMIRYGVLLDVIGWIVIVCGVMLMV